MTNTTHIPVLLSEAIDALEIVEGGWYIDATFGRGGHTSKILARGGKVIAIDQDEDAVIYARTHFVKEIEKNNLVIEHSNFDQIGEIAKKHQQPILGILADLGVSSPQVDTAERGFSFQLDAPLDMRMDKRLGVTAKDLVNGLGKSELMGMLTYYSQERFAKVISEAIVNARAKKPIETTKELAGIISSRVRREGNLHPATKTFMALRMQINDELGSLERFLSQALEVLEAKRRLITIAFHEGEDRIIKRQMKEWEEQSKGKMITDKPIMPSENEIAINVRSRSAKLRVFVKES